MKQQLKFIKAVPWVLFALLAIAPVASAQSTQDITYTWTPPTHGSAVHHYVVEHSANGGPFVQIATVTTNTYTLSADIGDSHQIRVAGVDALDRQGPYSDPSDPYTPELGPPGQPGKPVPLF